MVYYVYSKVSNYIGRSFTNINYRFYYYFINGRKTLRLMKLPKIATRHKIRDAKICRLWADGIISTKQIGEQFKLTETRIRAIVTRNHEFINWEIGIEKKRRIRWLKKQIALAGRSKKDSADLQDQLKTELEGNTPLVDNSTHYHFTEKEKFERGNRLKKLFSDSI